MALTTLSKHQYEPIAERSNLESSNCVASCKLYCCRTWIQQIWLDLPARTSSAMTFCVLSTLRFCMHHRDLRWVRTKKLSRSVLWQPRLLPTGGSLFAKRHFYVKDQKLRWPRLQQQWWTELFRSCLSSGQPKCTLVRAWVFLGWVWATDHAYRVEPTNATWPELCQIFWERSTLSSASKKTSSTA